MDFGLFLSAQAPIETEPETLFDELRQQTRTAEAAGFDVLSMGQHYLTDYNQLQLIPVLSRLSAESGDMTIATGIVLLPLHQPVEIAEQITTLDTIADNAIAGVGAGYRDVEFQNFGIPKSERAGRLEESVEIMNRLWTETDVTYDGEYYSIENATINPRPDTKPPVWIAANVRPAIERAARISDAWYVNPHATMTEIKEQKTAYDTVREELGKDTSVPVFRETFVAESSDAAYETARDFLEAKYQRYAEWGQDEAMEDADDIHRPFDDLAEDRFLLGTPEEICEEIERYEAELNASHIMMRVRWPGLPVEQACECIELIGDEVIPNV